MAAAPRSPMQLRPEPGHERLAYGLVALLGVMFVTTVVVAVLSLSGGGPDGGSSSEGAAPGPGFVKVKQGDSYGAIAAKADITVDELVELNPRVNPSALQPGQRLKLRADARLPVKRKRKGPMFWTVRTGQTLAEISERTGKSVIYLRELNKGVRPETLQPGDRLRLRKR